MTHQNCTGTGSTCGTGQDKIGQSYFIAVGGQYCGAVGTPGTDSTYSLAMATAAAAAGPQPAAGSCTRPPCVSAASCAGTTTNDSYYVDLSDTGGPCIVWSYKTTGSGATTSPSGHVHIDTAAGTLCPCPTSTDPTWD